MNIKRICIALIMAFLACSVGTWVRPGPESAGLSFADQLGFVIIPVLITFIGIWNETIGSRKRIVLIVLGYASLYISVYFLIKNSGLMMNIGKIDMAETITWLTPWFYIAMAVSAVSLLADILYLAGKKGR